MKTPRPKRWVVWRSVAALLGVAATAEVVRRLIPRLRRRVRTLAVEEEQEIEALIDHQETPRQFANHTLHFLHNFFIPHPGNDHRPHALRAPALFTYASAAIGIKVITFLLLAVIYPSVADLATIISGDIVLFANEARTEAGLPLLRVDPVLSAAAKAKGEDMLRVGYFAHESPSGRQPWEWIDTSSYDYRYAGENLAMDFTSAGAIHDAFMASPTHRANILNANYEDIGVAVVSGSLDGHPVDLLVQFFGTRKETVTAASAIPATSAKPVAAVTKPVSEPKPSVPAPVAVAEPVTSEPAPTPEPVAVVESTETHVPNVQPVVVQPTVTPATPVVFERDSDLVGLIIKFAQLTLIVMLAGVAIALLLSVIIRARVQHPSLILQSIAVLVIIATMLASRWHFVEQIDSTIHIL